MKKKVKTICTETQILFNFNQSESAPAAVDMRAFFENFSLFFSFS